MGSREVLCPCLTAINLEMGRVRRRLIGTDRRRQVIEPVLIMVGRRDLRSVWNLSLLLLLLLLLLRLALETTIR
jgi:hypothetical protein